MKMPKPLRAIARWLKFALSAKTRNRSRAQKAAWARRRMAQSDLDDIVINFESTTPSDEPVSLIDSEQDKLARKHGFRTIDELLDGRRG